MANTELAALLGEATFFLGMEDRHLIALAPHFRQEEFADKTTIFEEFDRAKDVYFIVDGRISLAICDGTRCRQISIIGKGDLLGWSPLVGRTRLFDTARTLSQVKTLVIDADELLAFCAAQPEFGFEFMRRAAHVLAERLSATRVQMFEIGGVHLPEFQLESD